MTYQHNMFGQDVMQDRSGRLHSYPAPPKTRAECAPRRHLRALPSDDPRAERCQCFGCPYNLIAEIGRLKNEEHAVRAMVDRYEQGIWDTCVLDVAGDGIESDNVIAPLMGVRHQMVPQVAASAALKFRRAFRADVAALEAMERSKRMIDGAPPFHVPEDHKNFFNSDEYRRDK